MQYLITNRLGVFVTRVSPRHIREHIYGLIDQRSTSLALPSSNKVDQQWFRDQVADILESDFVSCTQGIERMKQSLQADVTMTQPSLVCSQILIMLADAVPYNLITCSAPNELSGIHVTDNTLSPNWRVSVHATSALINFGCAYWEYKISQCCNSIIEELDREQNDYQWTRTIFEQQLYDWATAQRRRLPHTLKKAGVGVMRNTIDLIGSSIDAAKNDNHTVRLATIDGESSKRKEQSRSSS